MDFLSQRVLSNDINGLKRAWALTLLLAIAAAKDEKYFGFKGHLVTTQQGLIVNFTFTPANVDERDVLPELAQDFQGDIANPL